MPYHPVSKDLKACISMLGRDSYNVKDICNLLSIKKSLIYKTLDYDHHYGVLYNLFAHKRGWPQLLSLE